MAKRKRKAPPTNPDLSGLEAVTQADADEARILREIDASDKEPVAAGKARKAPAKRKRPKKR